MSSFLAWVTHGVKRGRLELGARTTVALSAVVAALTLITAIYLVLVSRTAAQGRTIERLQAEVLHLQRENEQAAVRIAETCAIPQVMARAQALGFAPADRIEFLAGSD